jgi:hypothetical protein
MGLCSKNLFIANDTQIKILSFKEKGGKENEVVEFVPTEKDFSTYALAPNKSCMVSLRTAIRARKNSYSSF